jgi:hypothetical protein
MPLNIQRGGKYEKIDFSLSAHHLESSADAWGYNIMLHFVRSAAVAKTY